MTHCHVASRTNIIRTRGQKFIIAFILLAQNAIIIVYSCHESSLLKKKKKRRENGSCLVICCMIPIFIMGLFADLQLKPYHSSKETAYKPNKREWPNRSSKLYHDQ